MKIRFLMAMTIAALCTIPLVGSAEDDFGRSGPYIRGGLAMAFDASSVLSDFIDTGIGLGVAAGYRLHPNIAVEGLYQWLGNTDVTFLGKTVTINRWDATANLKISTSGRFQPYAVAGIGYGKVSAELKGSSESGDLGGFLARLGGGLDIYITKNLAVYAEGAYMLTTGDIDEARYGTLGAGAMFRF